MEKVLKIAKWLIFSIVWCYSAINVILFVIALLFNCIDWNSERIVAEMIEMGVFILICFLWHIEISGLGKNENNKN